MKRGEWEDRAVCGWGWVFLAVVLLAVASTVANLTTPAQLAGEANEWLTARLILSKLVNSGTAWAGLLVLAGWLVRHPREAAAAAVLSGWGALALHYGLGQILGIYTAEIWAENLNWFAVTAIAGVLLGLVGSAAHRVDDLGVAARLVVPLGALLEPFVRGMLWPAETTPWPGQVSSLVCGGLLIVAGAIGVVLALLRIRGALICELETRVGEPADAVLKSAIPAEMA